MLNNILQNKSRIFLLIVFVFLLAGIRAYENQLFYDPFLVYFERDYKELPLPEFNSIQLFLGLLFRYFLNTIISLGIIYVIFRETELVKFASVLYVLFFLILIIAFYCIIYFYGNHNNLILFYVRRFLIQPILILLFIPGFYYQKINK
ncbi:MULTISPECIES: exosortase F system-associated protein [unclassified Flavobacterium]|jgi:exosortase F-associated protein|uniref:exosortase F system-associated membrane protein n=1 Tax=unclassified Flavobacterium TaxID=196869 RepID=UPI00057FEE85|nr:MULTISPECIES: exosortase F system-associated protein [unclassified Flavobacterium]KIC00453.1 membrane protein [Flavobacterium sp. KMS]OUL61902.1 exosortase F system-associated protein [Flavobacterium sp. AJR]